MKLNELVDSTTKRKTRKRVGRGIASGTGKTAGRGHKGQKSRKGVSINGFEGGQMPIFRRVPKRGFASINRVSYQAINLSRLQELLESNVIDVSKPINKAVFVEIGVIKRESALVKLLANGEVKASLNVTVDAASNSAIEKIEKAGGKVEILKAA